MKILFQKIKDFIRDLREKREKEYSKRLMNLIVYNCILMMWGTYLLAWTGRTEIAESLSRTIADSIVGCVIGILAKAVIENIFKYNDIFKNKSTSKSNTENKLVSKSAGMRI